MARGEVVPIIKFPFFCKSDTKGSLSYNCMHCNAIHTVFHPSGGCIPASTRTGLSPATMQLYSVDVHMLGQLKTAPACLCSNIRQKYAIRMYTKAI